MSFLQMYAIMLLIILGLMSALWLLSLWLKNSSIVDIFWGSGFVISAWVCYALMPGGYPPRRLLLCVLVTLWGLRLSLYVLYRNWDKGEDFRYRKWRQEAGPSWWWRSFFKVFLLQGLLMWLISAPLLAAQGGPLQHRLGILDYLAVAIWLVGFYFEAAGDFQLARFKANPVNRGMVMQRGVWRYTRHPNYFGDATQWWAFYLLAAAAGGWWSIFSPAVMTLLLVRVSGVALLEKTMEKRPGYREYIERTSAFVPWPPRARLNGRHKSSEEEIRSHMKK